jgi:T5orf172 domain
MTYKYFNERISNDVVRYWILQLFQGKEDRRVNILNSIIKQHVNLGGLNVGDVAMAFKSVLRNKSIGESVDGKHGFWKIHKTTDIPEIKLPNDEIKVPIDEIKLPIKEIGIGNEYVYVLKYHEKLIKVGYTKGDPQTRGKSLQTGNPSGCELVLKIRTSDGRKLEKVIHAILNYQNKWHEPEKQNSGSEFFNSTSEEIQSIYNSLLLLETSLV